MTIGEIITKYCMEHGISNQQFASICDVSKGYISMLINNKNPRTGKPLRPTIETYQKLAEGMNMTLDDLFEIMDDAPVRLRLNTSMIIPNTPSKEMPDAFSLVDDLLAENLSDHEIRLLRAYRLADDHAKKYALEMLENHPAVQEKENLA